MPCAALQRSFDTQVPALQVLADGHVYFTNEGAQRPSAEQALRSRFIATAARAAPVALPATSSSSAESESDAAAAEELQEQVQQERQAWGFFGMFRRMQQRASRLESDIVETVRRRCMLLGAAHCAGEKNLTLVRKCSCGVVPKRFAVGDIDAGWPALCLHTSQKLSATVLPNLGVVNFPTQPE